GEQFRKFAADHGVSFPQGHFYLSTEGIRPQLPADIAPSDPAKFEAVMAIMRRWIDLFNALDVKAGVLHAGGDGLRAAGWSEKRTFERRVEAVRRVAEYARGGPTLICLENLLPESGISTVAELIRIADAAGTDNTALCLDTGHANVAGVDPASFIRQAGPRLKAIHIADNLGSNDDHMLPYGRGTVKWTEVMKALREIKYSGLFNFEVPGEIRCPEPVLMAKLDYALELAKWMIAHDGVSYP
ncbi:MAG: sugar phosphate isomerase/epimerase family protein, partial [Kiritimatiellota bacterium]|nr:sugar phosphate isomerase/epimerase family protein [Kiritimatiellota bacterium]